MLVTCVAVSLIFPVTAPDSSLHPAMILSSSKLKMRSMPTLMPTAGTSLLLNMPTSLSYLQTVDHESVLYPTYIADYSKQVLQVIVQEMCH